MNPKATMMVYPRVDTFYRQNSSLDFDMMRSKIMLQRKSQGKQSIVLWTAHVLCGAIMGVIAFMVAYAEDGLTMWRANSLQKIIDNNNKDLVAAYFFYMFFSVIFVLCAALLTVYVGPGAMGSGIAEVMGLLNGINYHNAIGLKTLVVKILGTLLAVVGGLCIGKEGPLVHVGAIVGVVCCYLPFKAFRWLENDMMKRQMIAAGASCGVSVAFGAPIGGALFAYEISKPNTFWTFSMLWRVFTSTAIATFTLSIL